MATNTLPGQPVETDDGPPAVGHILRPHHVGILTIFVVVFKDFDNKLPPSFVLHVYRLLLQEVSEVTEPRTWQELLKELGNAPMSDAEHPKKCLKTLGIVHRLLQDADQMSLFFNLVSGLFSERPEDEGPLFTRRSLFGYFCRRCYISFCKLSFQGVVKLQEEYSDWREGNLKATYRSVDKDDLANDALLFKAEADRGNWAHPEKYAEYEKSQATGDENIAEEQLRRFFEQRFHEGNDSGLRQDALLHLVRVHYLRHEVPAAQKLLNEAISTARTVGDKVTLQFCISMLHRMPPPGQKPIINIIQPNLHPYEVLFDVKKYLQISSEQPLSASFERIAEGIGLYDQWADQQGPQHREAEQWGHHAVQAIVWNAAGCGKLAEIEENIVMAFTEIGGDDNNRITCILNNAYKKARRGEYEQALAMLMEPDVWRGLGMADYELWANEVWHLLVLHTSRRGQHRLYREFLKPLHPFGPYNPMDYFFESRSPPLSMLRDKLLDVMQMMHVDQASTSIEPLLTALWHSEFQCRYGFYRTGLALLADVGLQFGMTKRCRRILEEIMPQVISGDEPEQRALTCFTLARCILSTANTTPPSDNILDDALFYLSIAESDYRKLGMCRSLSIVRYYQAIVYHNASRDKDRDEAAENYKKSLQEVAEIGAVAWDDRAHEAWNLVTEVGAALGTR